MSYEDWQNQIDALRARAEKAEAERDASIKENRALFDPLLRFVKGDCDAVEAVNAQLRSIAGTPEERLAALEAIEAAGEEG